MVRKHLRRRTAPPKCKRVLYKPKLQDTEPIVSDVSTDQDAGTTDAENLNKTHEDCTAVTEQSSEDCDPVEVGVGQNSISQEDNSQDQLADTVNVLAVKQLSEVNCGNCDGNKQIKDTDNGSFKEHVSCKLQVLSIVLNLRTLQFRCRLN